MEQLGSTNFHLFEKRLNIYIWQKVLSYLLRSFLQLGAMLNLKALGKTNLIKMSRAIYYSILNSSCLTGAACYQLYIWKVLNVKKASNCFETCGHQLNQKLMIGAIDQEQKWNISNTCDFDPYKN